MFVGLEKITQMYMEDTARRKANKTANQVVLNAVELVKQFNPELKIDLDLSKGGTVRSRGIVVENLIKVWFKNSMQKTSRYASRGYDFKHNGVNYEVKCSTSKGYAHYNPKQDLSNLIFVSCGRQYLNAQME